MEEDIIKVLQNKSTKLISDLFMNHNVRCTVKDNKILFDKEQISIEVYCYDKTSNPNLNVLQLDVNLYYGINPITESFAGIGENFDSANINAIENFTHNSFHTILSAFFISKFDKEIQKYNWSINNREFEVYSSNIGIRGTKPQKLNTEWLKQFEIEILKLELEEGIHSIRLFYSQDQNQTTVCEVLLNNNISIQLQEKAKFFDWQKQEEFYSLRVFMILKNGIDFERIVKIIGTEEEYDNVFSRLEKIGLSEINIEKAYAFTPEVFGRNLVQDMGVLGNFTDDVIVVNNNNEEFKINVTNEKIYNQAVLLVNKLKKNGWSEDIKQIAFMSATFNTLNNAVSQGIKLEEIKCENFNVKFNIPTYSEINQNTQKKTFWKFW